MINAFTWPWSVTSTQNDIQHASHHLFFNVSFSDTKLLFTDSKNVKHNIYKCSLTSLRYMHIQDNFVQAAPMSLLQNTDFTL